MILVTLGTQKFQMNRLVEAMDKIAPSLAEEIFIQVGNSTYQPENCQYENFVNQEKFAQLIKNCSLLITHSGVGSIMAGIQAKKPIIVVPRRAKYHEHVDDHQMEIAKAFSGKGCVLSCTDVAQLREKISKARHFEFQPYIAPDSRVEDILVDYIQKNIEDNTVK